MLRNFRISNLFDSSAKRLGVVTVAASALSMTLLSSPGHADAPADEASTVGDKAKEDRFKLKVEVGNAKVGQKATAKVSLTPIDPWHVNMEFPTSLKLTAPADVKLAKEKLKKGDAKAMSEHGGAQFEVEFTPTAKGEKKIDAKLKFAICIESSCSPVTETFTIKTSVK